MVIKVTKSTVVEQGTDRQKNIQTGGGSQHRLMPLTVGRGYNNCVNIASTGGRMRATAAYAGG